MSYLRGTCRRWFKLCHNTQNKLKRFLSMLRLALNIFRHFVSLDEIYVLSLVTKPFVLISFASLFQLRLQGKLTKLSGKQDFETSGNWSRILFLGMQEPRMSSII